MIRTSLLGVALVAGACGVARAQYPAPSAARHADPCAAAPHPALRVPAPEAAPRPRVQGPATPAPAETARIPSPYVRDYAPNAQAFPAPEPILAPPRQKVEVQEFRSGVEPSSPKSPRYYDTYTVAADDGAVAPAAQPGLRGVRFWNLSDRPLTLRLGETVYPLERGQSLSLELPASFQWRVTGREPETTELEGQPGLEIVIRR